MRSSKKPRSTLPELEFSVGRHILHRLLQAGGIYAHTSLLLPALQHTVQLGLLDSNFFGIRWSKAMSIVTSMNRHPPLQPSMLAYAPLSSCFISPQLADGSVMTQEGARNFKSCNLRGYHFLGMKYRNSIGRGSPSQRGSLSQRSLVCSQER
jgi:hypothetical protein